MGEPNQTVTDSFVFDGLADRYDKTRTIDQEAFDAALQYLVDRFPPQNHASVVDAGGGTGRIATPFAEHGYHVTGVDRSADMLSRFREQRRNNDSRLSCVRGDVTDLPFVAGSFDLALAVHLFYFVRDWQPAIDDLFRVLTEHGTLVVMHTGFGRSIPSLNNRYQQLCAQRGHPVDTPGVESSQEVVEYVRQHGYDVEHLRDRWTWTASVSIATALRNLQHRAYSFTSMVPDAVHTAVIDDLRDDLSEEYGTLDTTVAVSNQLYMILISRS